MDGGPPENAREIETCRRRFFSSPPICLPPRIRLPSFFHSFLLPFPLNTLPSALRIIYHSALSYKGIPLKCAGYTFNRNRSRRVCLPRDSRETVVSWRKCRRKVVTRLGYLVASASTCVASGISSESPRSTCYRSKKSLVHSLSLSFSLLLFLSLKC